MTLLLLRNMLRYGLGISTESVSLPLNIEAAIAAKRQGDPALVVNEVLLQEELSRRISDEPFILDAEIDMPERKWLIGAVDGSTRAGVLSFLGEDGDFVTGHAPMVSINTAVGQVNRSLKIGDRSAPLFLRLPEKPEDMQRQDNRFTVMAKLLQPDLSDAEYMHSVWNAMDLIEARAALRLLSNWPAPKTGIEVPAADVVLRDGVCLAARSRFHPLRRLWHIRSNSPRGNQDQLGDCKTLPRRWSDIRWCYQDRTTVGLRSRSQLVCITSCCKSGWTHRGLADADYESDARPDRFNAPADGQQAER